MTGITVRKGAQDVWQEIKLDDFDLDLSDSEKERFGEAVIEYMRKRVASGGGMDFGSGGKSDGSAFDLKSVKYSKDYIKSLAFKAWGKSPSRVNMRLTGDMLELLDVIEVKDNKIIIGWDDTTQHKKAFNHVTGDTLPRRPFFGLNDLEIEKIAKKFRK